MTGANDKGADGLSAGSEREVHHWQRLFADDVECIADDAYNLRDAVLQHDLNVFADRVLTGKVLIGERLADDHLVGRLQSLAGVKCTPTYDRNAHRDKI